MPMIRFHYYIYMTPDAILATKSRRRASGIGGGARPALDALATATSAAIYCVAAKLGGGDCHMSLEAHGVFATS